MNKFYFLFLELVVILSFICVPFQLKRGMEVNNLYTYSVFIDPGHGGNDNGCNYQEIYEDQLNLSISLSLYEELVNQGIRVYLTRDGDYDLSKENSINHKNDDLRKRAFLINSFQVDLVVSIHMNFYQDESVLGPMVYYKEDDESRKIASSVQLNLNQFTNQDKVAHKEEFYLFTHTNCRAILVECGFLSNERERNNLTNSTYQNLISKEIAKGIINYINN